MPKAEQTFTPSRRALLQGATAAAILAPAAALASGAPSDHPNDARLLVLVADYQRVREEICDITDRSEQLQRALGISQPPHIEYPNFLMEADDFYGEAPHHTKLHRAWSEADIVRGYESRIELAGEAWVERRDRQIERFRKVAAEWHAANNREDVTQLRSEKAAAWNRCDEIEEEIRAIKPDTIEGLVTQLRHHVWDKVGSDYADKPLEDHDWDEQALLTILDNAERLAGGVA